MNDRGRNEKFFFHSLSLSVSLGVLFFNLNLWVRNEMIALDRMGIVCWVGYWQYWESTHAISLLTEKKLLPTETRPSSSQWTYILIHSFGSMYQTQHNTFALDEPTEKVMHNGEKKKKVTQSFAHTYEKGIDYSKARARWTHHQNT